MLYGAENIPTDGFLSCLAGTSFKFNYISDVAQWIWTGRANSFNCILKGNLDYFCCVLYFLTSGKCLGKK